VWGWETLGGKTQPQKPSADGAPMGGGGNLPDSFCTISEVGDRHEGKGGSNLAVAVGFYLFDRRGERAALNKKGGGPKSRAR